MTKNINVIMQTIFQNKLPNNNKQIPANRKLTPIKNIRNTQITIAIAITVRFKG